MRWVWVFTLLLAACSSGPKKSSPSGSGQETSSSKAPAKSTPKKKKSPSKKKKKSPKGEEGLVIERDAASFSDSRPVPVATKEEIKDFNRIWELFRRGDRRWPRERDRFKRRSDAAAYLLSYHVIRYYMKVNVDRNKAYRDLTRAKNEIVAVGEPCAPYIVDLMALDKIPLVEKGKFFRADDLTRQDCLDMLERMGPQATPHLLKVLERKDLGEKGRRLTALALGGTKDPRGYSVLVSLLRKDPSWQVRADAATGLGKLGDKRAIRPLQEAVLKDKDAAVVKRAGKVRAQLLRGE